MTGRSVWAMVAFVGLAGCVSYRGGARPLDPRRLISEPGWFVATSTPELRQQGTSDCGAAALAMIAGRWNILLTVAEVAAVLPDQSLQGTRLGDLRDVARALGLQAFAIAGDRDTLVKELRAGRPVIVGLLMPYNLERAQRHYEVIVALHQVDGRFVTINPASGMQARSWEDLDAEWLPVGRPTLIVLGRAPVDLDLH